MTLESGRILGLWVTASEGQILIGKEEYPPPTDPIRPLFSRLPLEVALGVRPAFRPERARAQEPDADGRAVGSQVQKRVGRVAQAASE